MLGNMLFNAGYQWGILKTDVPTIVDIYTYIFSF